jgi:hypothetical protein
VPHLPAYALRQARRTDALGTDAKDIGRGVPKTTVFGRFCQYLQTLSKHPLCTPITHVIIYVTKPAPFYLLAVRVMLVEYARVSTGDQALDLQKNALTVASYGQVFIDVTPGADSSRPGVEAALIDVPAGDTIVGWRLDRLGRSLHHLIFSGPSPAFP